MTNALACTQCCGIGPQILAFLIFGIMSVFQVIKQVPRVKLRCLPPLDSRDVHMSHPVSGAAVAMQHCFVLANQKNKKQKTKSVIYGTNMEKDI